MNPEELDRRLDEWLDRATAEYGMVEMRPGFEARIIEKANSRLAARRWHCRLAATMAALLFVSIQFLRTPTQQRGIEERSSEALSESASLPSDIRIPRDDAQHSPLPGSGSSIQPSMTMRAQNDFSSEKKQTALRGRFLSSELSDRERYLIAYVQEKAKSAGQDLPEDALFDPLDIGAVQIPKFQIESFKMSFQEIQVAPTSIAQSKDQL